MVRFLTNIYKPLMSKSTIQEIYKHNLVWEDKISRWNVLLLYHINVNSHRIHIETIIERKSLDIS